MALVISGLVTKISEVCNQCFKILYLKLKKNIALQNMIYPKSILFHIGIGAIFFLLTLCIWGYENRALMKLGFDKYKRRMSVKDD